MRELHDKIKSLQIEVMELRDKIKDLSGGDMVPALAKLLGRGQSVPAMAALMLYAHPRPVALNALRAVASKRDQTVDPSNQALRVHIVRLRHRLREIGCPGGIKVVWGHGYAMDAEAVAWIKERIGQ